MTTLIPGIDPGSVTPVPLDGASLKVYGLQSGGAYALQSRSPAFPFLPLDEVERFLARRNDTDDQHGTACA